MSYNRRVLIVSASLAILTLALVVFAPRNARVALAAHSPSGMEAPAGAPVRVTFSRPVDRAAAEASFTLEPPSSGRFFWEDRTLTFQPDQLLIPETTYRVRFGPGLIDTEGRPVVGELGWEFRTRGPRLLAVRATATGGGELWLVGPDGSGARRLATAPDGISEVAVAPDGTRAVYAELRGVSRSALMLIDLESGATRPLVDDETASFAAPAWSSASDFIVFERRAVTAAGQLGVPRVWLAQPDGTLLGPLTRGDDSDIGYAPAWSPDGNAVASIDGLSQTVKVYSFFTDAVRELPATSGERPAWLPDGSALVYSSATVGPEGPVLRLRLVTLGSEPTSIDLTDGEAAELGPAVAPNGAAVAFTRRGRDGPVSRIWLVATAGGEPRALSTAGPHQDTQPAWSPDGQLVSFVRSNTSGPPLSRAMVVDATTGAERVVLDDVIQVVWAP